MTEENGGKVFTKDLRTGNEPDYMHDITYEISIGDMLEEVNAFRNEFEKSGLENYDIVAWALFTAIREVLGDSPATEQIKRMSATLTAFFEAHLEDGVIEAYDERSEPAA